MWLQGWGHSTLNHGSETRTCEFSVVYNRTHEIAGQMDLGHGSDNRCQHTHYSEVQVSFMLVIQSGKVCPITCTFGRVALHTRVRVCPFDQNSLGEQLLVDVAIVGHHKSGRENFVPFYFKVVSLTYMVGVVP